MHIISLFFYLILIVFGVTFAALNASSVPVNFYFVTYKMPVAILISLMWIMGMIIGFLIFLKKYLHLKFEQRKLKHQLKLTEKEIKNLRSIPLHDQP